MLNSRFANLRAYLPSVQPDKGLGVMEFRIMRSQDFCRFAVHGVPTGIHLQCEPSGLPTCFHFYRHFQQALKARHKTKQVADRVSS